MEFVSQQIETRSKDIEVLKMRIAIESNKLNELGNTIDQTEQETKQILKPARKDKNEEYKKLDIQNQKEDNASLRMKL